MIIRIGLVILGLLLCAWKFSTAVMGAEQIRDEGTQVLFELAPADPREFLLGDYMRLRYAVEALPPIQPDDDESRGGLAVIIIGEDGVGSFVRLADAGTALGKGEHLIKYTELRRGQPSYGGTRYYFQSGTAKRFADAEYGVFRVMPDGRALLAGLAGEDKQIIAIAGEASPADNED